MLFSCAEKKSRLAIMLILLSVTFGVFLFPILHSEFLNWDDDLYLTQNELLQSEAGFFWIWVDNQMPNPYPITFSLLRLEFLCFGLNSVLFHFVNLAFHLFNIMLLGGVLRFFKVSRFVQISTLFIYALHPVQVETVMWVSELKNLVSAFFYWMSLWAFLKYFEKKTHQAFYYSLGFTLFVLSLASKSMTVTLPVTLLLWGFLFDRTALKQIIVALVPLFSLSVFFALLSMKNEVLFYQRRNLIFFFYSFFERIHNVVESFLFYLWKFFFPFSLSAVYPPHPLFDPASKIAYVAMGGGLLFLSSFIFFRKFWSQQKLILFALLNYGIVLGPVSGFFPTTYTGLTIVADRYNYHSLPFLALACCLLLQHIFSIHKKKKIQFGFGLLLFPMIYFSYQHAWNWTSSVALWTQTSRVHSKSAFVYEYLGRTYWEKGQVELAEQAYEHAVKAQPDYYLARNNYANFLVLKGDLKKALEHYLFVVAKAPDFGMAHHNLGNIYYFWKQEENAIRCYEQALQAKHPSNLGLVNLGELYLKKQHSPKALDCFQQALKENVETTRAHQKLAQMYQGTAEAEKHLLAFLKDSPTEILEWIVLAHWYASQENELAALKTYQNALKYNATDFLLWKKYLAFSLPLTKKQPKMFQEIQQVLREKSTTHKLPFLSFLEAFLFGENHDYVKALLQIRAAIATESLFPWNTENHGFTPHHYRNGLRIGNLDLLQELEK